MADLRDYLRQFAEIAPSQRGYSKRTMRVYRWTCGRVCDFIGKDATLADFSAANLLRWQSHIIASRREQGLSPHATSTLNRYYGAVKAWSCWMYKRKILAEDVAQCLEPGKPNEPRRHEITDETAFAMIDACDLIDSEPRRLLCRAVLCVLVHGGLRLFEILNLTVADFQKGKRCLVVRNGKGGKSRTVPLCGMAVRAIEDYLRVRPEDRRQGEARRDNLFMYNRQFPAGVRLINTIIRQCARLARYPAHVTPHSFRHCYATRLLRNSHGDIVAVAKLLGHSRTSTTLNTYAHTDEARIRAVAELSEQISAPVPSIDPASTPDAEHHPRGEVCPAPAVLSRSRRVDLRRRLPH